MPKNLFPGDIFKDKEKMMDYKAQKWVAGGIQYLLSPWISQTFSFSFNSLSSDWPCLIQPVQTQDISIDVVLTEISCLAGSDLLISASDKSHAYLLWATYYLDLSLLFSTNCPWHLSSRSMGWKVLTSKLANTISGASQVLKLTWAHIYNKKTLKDHQDPRGKTELGD